MEDKIEIKKKKDKITAVIVKMVCEKCKDENIRITKIKKIIQCPECLSVQKMPKIGRLENSKKTRGLTKRYNLNYKKIREKGGKDEQ